ncbi:MAG: SIS domain-containing protein [Alphaproteobacteria bacterium]|nr:MAG: SIS domain-containing protein [Alphaproteobacteria bacterium]
MLQKLLSHAVDLKEITNNIKTFNKIIFIGTGGSSLVGQALKCIAQPEQRSKILFFDNIDPRTFREKILPLTKEKTFFILISKSGRTSEVLAQTDSLSSYLSARNTLVITEATNNPLRNLAEIHGWKILEHPAEIGGRFSAFTVVGLLPCLLLGLSDQRFIEGAQNALNNQDTIQKKIEAIYDNHPIDRQIILSYSDYTGGLLGWMSQLIAESLGKTPDKSIIPITARGTVDQHSQLQLWMDGPKNQFFQIYFFHDALDQSQIYVNNKAFSYDQLFKIHSQATRKALEDNGYYVEYKEYAALDEETLGEIMMEKFIEVFAFAKLMQINPEGQPGVERAKKAIGLYI